MKNVETPLVKIWILWARTYTKRLARQIIKDVLDNDIKSVAARGVVTTEEIESVCPRCGTKSQRLHQNHRYIVKDLPWAEKPVYLEINRRQFKCEKCRKPFSEDLIKNTHTR